MAQPPSAPLSVPLSGPLSAPAVPASVRGRRPVLWLVLVALVLVMLGTLVWLAGRYEASQVQGRLERDAVEAVQDLRQNLARNLLDLQALQAEVQAPRDWAGASLRLLREHRELVHLEWRDSAMQVVAATPSPYHARLFERLSRQPLQPEVAQACAQSRRFSGPAYAPSYFVPQTDGVGMEVMELCLPWVQSGRVTGFVLAGYGLPQLLVERVGPQLSRGQEVSLIEPDGTRLAMHGTGRRGARVFTTQQLLTLPGHTLILRMNSWRAGPDLFPNVMTALVTVLSVGLISVLVLLGRDIRRRTEAERNLADALAFRKAMEDSLITGLQARDMHGFLRYVNPGFCQMVGYSAEELVAPSTLQAPRDAVPDAPYWPPEQIAQFRQRLTDFEARARLPREGFESEFVRRDGTRFPVLTFVAPLINAAGQQTGWMSAFVDLSEQRRIEEQSRASQERLQATARLATVGEMASLMSHELNQPLAAISSYATGSLNLLGDGTAAGPAGDTNTAGPAPAAGAAGVPGSLRDDLRTALQRIAGQADRAGKVIASIHNFVRRREGRREAVHPHTLIDPILPLIQLQASKLGVRVVLQVPGDLPAVPCDRTMLEQVLLNLARNGMQAMDSIPMAQRELTLGAWANTQVVGFTVTDHGPGVPPEVADRLFTPFFTTKAEGMGLGLSLCRTVVEQHGGKLEFERSAAGATIFRFSLPQRAL